MNAFDKCLNELGFGQPGTGELLRQTDSYGSYGNSPFAPEIRSLFTPSDHQGLMASAVFCIQQVPTLCLIDGAALPQDPLTHDDILTRFCQRLWNQNLVSAVLVLTADRVEVWSVLKKGERRNLEVQEAKGYWSAPRVASGEIAECFEDWFRPSLRVDEDLLGNIIGLVRRLDQCGIPPDAARVLIAQVIFVCYLEHREIIGDEYRSEHSLATIRNCFAVGDRDGLEKLLTQLRSDFNGDFLSQDSTQPISWKVVDDRSFDLLAKFLARTDMQNFQGSFWHYDFSEIPVELISGIYETFLQTKALPEKKRHGAYYTPRNLAAFVVDEAFADRNPLDQTVIDGACGSGILLTTAYRRMLQVAEDRAGRTLSFVERKQLLLERIRGADIDGDACRLTAFSLYVALLSGLEPVELMAHVRAGEKLPALRGQCLYSGLPEGDFFSENSRLGKGSIFLSNPPWVEPERDDLRTFEKWGEDNARSGVPRRQIACAFALKVSDSLEENGRTVLILPATVFVAGSKANAGFRRHLLSRYTIEKIFNFSDLRRLIFSKARHPFVVMVARRRAMNAVPSMWFEYVTPKADLALAFGRLAIHREDRTRLPAPLLASESGELGLRYWGTDFDISLLRRLQARGTVGELIRNNGWILKKGFHLTDGKKTRAPSEFLCSIPFLPANAFPKRCPVLQTNSFKTFPFKGIANEPESRLFQGPRLLWPDGTHPEEGDKAIFSDRPFSCQSSVAILSSTPVDIRLLRFLALSLHSTMGRYLLPLICASVSAERPKLQLNDMREFPLWHPDHHPNPEEARAIIDEATKEMESLESDHSGFLGDPQPPWDKIDDWVYRYFLISPEDQDLIREMVQFVNPSLQPSSATPRGLRKIPLLVPPQHTMLVRYTERLEAELSRWIRGTGGSGTIKAQRMDRMEYPFGLVRLTISPIRSGMEKEDVTTTSPNVISNLVKILRATRPSYPERNSLFLSDLMIMDKSHIWIVKPLRTRFWLLRSAVSDAARIVSTVQAGLGN